ncbi:uncharacterized protein LOC120111195 [Phoenix dactylifera]|uniref:Uncharacterized protein LOC120111195 n=1 Tax=Phoenix dactylifera TaxID=42345 RepID=A0A8B9AD54_PHODC|nr:uncharacterized protein LOC120111195 [Phoenix dactylifera]
MDQAKGKLPMVGSSGSVGDQASGTMAVEANKDSTMQTAAPPSRSWAEVVAQDKGTSKGTKGDRSGGRGRPGPWVTHRMTEAEVARVSQYFPSVTELPEEPIEAARREWEGLALIGRSLGRRVPVEWVAKDVAARLKKTGEVVGVSLAEDHFALRFRSPELRDRALLEGPWVVAGQLLAMEPWAPDFLPRETPVKSVVVWLRLPGLPPEYWSPSTIMDIAAKAGRPMAVDGVTEGRRAMGFARVKVAIDASEPLLPGIRIQGRSKTIWQPFVFESVSDLCVRCGPNPLAQAAGPSASEFHFGAQAPGQDPPSVCLASLGSLEVAVGQGDGASGGSELGDATSTSEVPVCDDCPMSDSLVGRDTSAPVESMRRDTLVLVEPGVGDPSGHEGATRSTVDHSTVVQRVKAAVLRVVSGTSTDEGQQGDPDCEMVIDPMAQRVDEPVADLSDFSP